MSAELISAVSLSPLPIGLLADGTLYYAPIGEVVVTGALVTCHLCGRSLRSVTAHLRVHGWTKLAYCEAFGLERSQSLEGPETRKLRAAALTSRLVFEPAMREGSAAGRARARTGDLTRDAVRAARGRRMPEQRRRKAVAALATIPPMAVAQANRDRASRHLTAPGPPARGPGRRPPRLRQHDRLCRQPQGGRLDLAGDSGRMRPAAVVVAAAGTGHVPAPTALNMAERSPALASVPTVTRLAWPASRGAGWRWR
jgi:hypothetical protein